MKSLKIKFNALSFSNYEPTTTEPQSYEYDYNYEELNDYED